MPRRLSIALALLVCVASTSGCGSSSDASKPLVVATTTQLGDFARNIAGGAVDVHQILRPNTDPHEYEPRPDDIQATSNAKLALLSGDNLDNWMQKIVDQAGGHPSVVTVGDAVRDHVAGESNGPEASKFDAHWWHDPLNAVAAVERIRAALVATIAEHKATFNRNAAAYTSKLRRLDAGIRRCFDSVPRSERKLVTSHDAFNYFAKRYGIEVVGAIVPSQTTEAQPSAGDVARLVRQIKREKVHAIFLESSVNPKLAKAVARQTDTVADLTLYGDTLGPAGSRGASYIGMERANADAMMRGFTAGKRGCPAEV